MNKINLTICIPTFNRSEYLFRLLSILAKVDSSILSSLEVKIFDNNSTDKTQEIVKGFKDTFRLIYKKQKVNIGGTKNVIDIIQNCNGKYIWVLGDDDYIKIEQFEEFYNEFIIDKPANIWYFVGFEGEDGSIPFKFDKISSFFKKNNLEKTIHRFGLNFTGFLGSHIFPSSCLNESNSVTNLEVNCWPHLMLFLKSKRRCVFSDKRLSVKSGDLEWEPLGWYIALLSQILCIENAYFDSSTKIALMSKLIFSIRYNKYLIYSHISPNYNFKLTNKRIKELKHLSNYKPTKILLTLPLILNHILNIIPSIFLIKAFNLSLQTIKVPTKEAINRKL